MTSGEAFDFHEQLARSMINRAKSAQEGDAALYDDLHDLAASAPVPELLATYLAVLAAERAS